MLSKLTAKYLLKRVNVTFNSGIYGQTIDNVILGQLPKRIIIGFIENKAYNVQVTSRPLQPDFSSWLSSSIYMRCELNTEVKLVRKTRTGSVLVVVGESDDVMKSLQEAIKSVIGQTGTVIGKISSSTLNVRDIDGHTTKEKVFGAIIAAIGCGERDAKEMRKCSSSIQTRECKWQWLKWNRPGQQLCSE
ncbi:hypothetical protein TSAR_011790 [Trichomalopsis sarcophagae]|uniref:Uncharacterized protein n=1 Tax=Trichomalopsis sarcophagae TaxID=543379 RepID=A0A232ELR8_9HYME|nr:hypothetical protein TSAR_011790 [Trichomalopsis sarcophagae]